MSQRDVNQRLACQRITVQIKIAKCKPAKFIKHSRQEQLTDLQTDLS